MGDMQFYVDTSIYKVYEYSVDGYFGEYRNGNSDVFTFDMAVRRLENEPGSGEGIYYVTPDFLDICFE